MPLCKGEYALLPGSPLGVSRLEFSRIAGVVAGRDDLAYLKALRAGLPNRAASRLPKSTLS